jgi:hypothetical protein
LPSQRPEAPNAHVAGGKAWPITEAFEVHGATWLEDDTIVYGNAMD